MKNDLLADLFAYAKENQGTYIFPGWDGDRVARALEAAQAQPTWTKESLDWAANAASRLDKILPVAQPVGVPAGMKLVPIEPTLDMVNAGANAQEYPHDDIYPHEAQRVYLAMLAAAPSIPVDEKAASTLLESHLNYTSNVLRAGPTAKAEFPVVAIVEDWPDDRQPMGIVRRVPWSELPEGTELVRLTDAQAAIAGAKK